MSNKNVCGLALLLSLQLFLTSCSKSSGLNNGSGATSYPVSNETATVSWEVVPRDQNMSADRRNILDTACGPGEKALLFRASDKNSGEPIPGLEVIVKESGEVVYEFVTDPFDDVAIPDFDLNGNYTISISALPIEYGNRGTITYDLEIRQDNLSTHFSEQDYYIVPYVSFVFEKEIDRMLIGTDEMLGGEIQVSAFDCDTASYISGVNFSVCDSTGKIVDAWTSSDRPHNVYGLGDDTYLVKVENWPSDFNLDLVTNGVGSSLGDTTECPILIRDGNGGESTFYFRKKNLVRKLVR